MGEIGPILMATDFSTSSRLALDLAATLAQRFDEEVMLLHVDVSTTSAPLDDVGARRREVARLELERGRAQLAGQGVRTRVMLRPGDPAREILRVAAVHMPGVIVVGTHGASAAATTLLGSVADRVMRYAPLPVLLVPDPTRRRAGSLSGGCAAG
jgi:nucleotide-binding universal stress UspA family protein